MTRRPYQSPAVDRLEQQGTEREERRVQPVVHTIVDANKPPHSPRPRKPVVEGQAALPL